MAETVATAYPTSTSPGNPEQQYVQHQYAYQAQATSPGAHQYYSGASGVEQQVVQETGDQQAAGHPGQEVAYAQYTRSGAELANEQQVGGAGFEQANAGIVQQYAGAAGQLAQQQGPNGYKINFDPNPQIIRKHANDAVTYKQEVAVRYLRPPTPPPPGPLIIKEVRNPALPPAPPIGGFEAVGDQGLLASASNGSLAGAGQAGFIQDNVQYAAYANANVAGQVPGEQQGGFIYQQAAYSAGSTVEDQQYAPEAEQPGQQGNGFVQNVQYQTIPQYGVSG